MGDGGGRVPTMFRRRVGWRRLGLICPPVSRGWVGSVGLGTGGGGGVVVMGVPSWSYWWAWWCLWSRWALPAVRATA